jgi:hypothetical protein
VNARRVAVSSTDWLGLLRFVQLQAKANEKNRAYKANQSSQRSDSDVKPGENNANGSRENLNMHQTREHQSGTISVLQSERQRADAKGQKKPLSRTRVRINGNASNRYIEDDSECTCREL